MQIDRNRSSQKCRMHLWLLFKCGFLWSIACSKWRGHISIFANLLPKNVLKIAQNNVFFLSAKKETNTAHEFSKSEGRASMFSCIRPIQCSFELF